MDPREAQAQNFTPSPPPSLAGAATSIHSSGSRPHPAPREVSILQEPRRACGERTTPIPSPLYCPPDGRGCLSVAHVGPTWESWQGRRAHDMFGAWLGVSEVPWETAPDTLCHKPRPFLFLSPLHSPVLLSPFLSTASALEEPMAKRLLNTVWPALALPEGGGEAAAWGSPQAPNSVTSLHMLQTNKTLTRVTCRAPQAEGAVSPPVSAPGVAKAPCLCWGSELESLSADPPEEVALAPISGYRTLGERRRGAAAGGPRRRRMCLCVSPLIQSSPPEGRERSQSCSWVVLIFNHQPRWKGRTFPVAHGSPNCQSSRVLPEASQAIPTSLLLLSRSWHLCRPSP